MESLNHFFTLQRSGSRDKEKVIVVDNSKPLVDRSSEHCPSGGDPLRFSSSKRVLKFTIDIWVKMRLDS
jgi:hypothetical protein